MRKILINIFCLFFTFSFFGQENDFQTWHSLSIKKEINKNTDLNLRVGLRFRENSSLFSKKFIDMRISNELHKKISIAAGYRYISSMNKEFEQLDLHRFYFDLNYKNKFNKRWLYSIRNRWQYQFQVYGNEQTFRQRFSLKYNIRKTKITPYCSVEYFSNTFGQINKLRSTFAFSYPILKYFDFDLAYRIQNEFMVNNPQTIFIFESKISYDL